MAEQISLEALAQRKSMQAAPAAQPGSAAQIETKIEADAGAEETGQRNPGQH